MNITGEEILPSDQSRMIKKPHLVILPQEKPLKNNENN